MAVTGSLVRGAALPCSSAAPYTCASEAEASPCDCNGCSSSEGASKFVHEYLEANGFPGELFPTKEVVHCSGDFKTGSFSIQLRGEVEKDVDVPGFNGSLKFLCELKGQISKGKIKRLKGVTITALGVTLPLDAVTTGSMCKNKVFFYVGVEFSGIPISVLRTLWD